ncbi:hypothetical protein AG4045_021030 [Apium graveolens]|uniref:Leucine-rich repeat-containing N-terminal plant-type domain-containing protein n=1 Tax=Apium graveolens TaxID=4045 RepID=A0A6L5BC78_APIGR|nr:hypothetical protein AG4045_021030 [Apium graveolens]
MYKSSKLHLPGMDLTGHVLENTIGNLRNLVTLSLRSNALSGSLPLDFSSLSDLRNLYLESNEFSGPIPSFIFSLENIVHVNLGSLNLEKNQLSGEIPNLDLPDLIQFNVSDNLLTGNIPEKLSSKAESAFAGNRLCGRPLKSCSGGDKKFKGVRLIGLVVVLIAMFDGYECASSPPD